MPVIDDRTAGRSYALPNAANKIKDDVTRLREALAAVDADVVALLAALATKAALVHGHSIDQITGLVSALDGKAAADHQHALADLTDTDVAGAANGQLLKRVGTKWSPVFLALGDIEGWQDTVAAMIAQAVSGLVASSPDTLNTLDELAAALGDDPNFATTVLAAVGTKLAKDQNLADLPDKATARANLGAYPTTGGAITGRLTAETYNNGGDGNAPIFSLRQWGGGWVFRCRTGDSGNYSGFTATEGSDMEMWVRNITGDRFSVVRAFGNSYFRDGVETEGDVRFSGGWLAGLIEERVTAVRLGAAVFSGPRPGPGYMVSGTGAWRPIQFWRFGAWQTAEDV